MAVMIITPTQEQPSTGEHVEVVTESHIRIMLSGLGALNGKGIMSLFFTKALLKSLWPMNGTKEVVLVHH